MLRVSPCASEFVIMNSVITAYCYYICDPLPDTVSVNFKALAQRSCLALVPPVRCYLTKPTPLDGQTMLFLVILGNR